MATAFCPAGISRFSNELWRNHGKGIQHVLTGRSGSIEVAVSQEVAMSRVPDSPADKRRGTGCDIDVSITGLRILIRWCSDSTECLSSHRTRPSRISTPAVVAHILRTGERGTANIRAGEVSRASMLAHSSSREESDSRPKRPMSMPMVAWEWATRLWLGSLRGQTIASLSSLLVPALGLWLTICDNTRRILSSPAVLCAV